MALFNKAKVQQVIAAQTTQEKKHSILLIDDEPDNLLVLSSLLETDYKVFTATSGAMGLEIVRKEQVHLVISDQRMPGMTGVEVLTHVVEEQPGTVRIILTGFTDVEAIITAINTGKIYQYVTKPWNDEDLRIIIRQALEKYDLTSENQQLLETLKERNKELESLNNNLEAQVEERSRELVAAHEELAQLNRKIFQRFVSPNVVDKLLHEAENGIQTYSVKKRLSVFFADIRGFTALSESLEPPQLCSIINIYFTEMTQIVNEFNGTLDKFIGDAVMVFFNDPNPQDDHAERAVNMAIKMQQRMQELESIWLSKGLDEPLKIGIGISTGEATVGNFGSDNRMDYTIIGHQVNLAARLVSIAGSEEILVDENTRNALSANIEFEERDQVSVKGISRPVKHYRVLSETRH